MEETKAIVGTRLPLTFDSNGDSEAVIWPAAAAALLARGVVIMETTAILAEQNRMADAQVSLRVMLEHAVVFCWIAIDPQANLTEWRRWDDWRRLKVHRDAAMTFEPSGVSMLPFIDEAAPSSIRRRRAWRGTCG